MPDKLHKTKGIVLRTVKYGETSLVVTLFTELFGVQAYLVNGIRTVSRKGNSKAALFQPAAILDLVVYHNELRHLHRIREFRWGYLYNHIFNDVPRNAVALFMMELLGKCLKQPEGNPDLYYFTEDVLESLDQSEGTVMANLPLFFALQLPVHFGFRISDNRGDKNVYLDLQEGIFVPDPPLHPHFLEPADAAVAAQILNVMHPAELEGIPLGHDQRRRILQRLEPYYAMHIQDFGMLRSLPVLREVLG